MVKKTFAIMLILALLLTTFIIPTSAAEGPSDKSMYFSNDQAVNGVPASSGSNVMTVISGDVLKIKVLGKSDPNFGIELNSNVDTNVYKICALKVKKTHAPATGGEIFYNVKGQGAVGGKSVTFNYAEGTDYQWIYVDLGAKNAGDVGFIRFDVYQESPSDLEYLTLAAVGFFKSVDDMNAFAQTDTGKNLGKNEGTKGFPETLSGGLNSPGVWLNDRIDATKPGYYWVKFNTALPFYKFNVLQIYAGTTKDNTGTWKLFKHNTDLETTMAGTPVAQGAINQKGDKPFSIEFGKNIPAGQYVLYIEQDMTPDTYLNIGTSAVEPDPKKFEYGFNGTKFDTAATTFIAASIEFVGTTDVYFKDLIPDGAPNPETGDISLLGFAALGLVSVLTKKRKVK